MVSILHGTDPSSVSFNVSARQRHLQQGLKNKKKSVFPLRKMSFVKKPVLKVTGLPIIVYMSNGRSDARARLHVYMYSLAVSTLPGLKHYPNSKAKSIFENNKMLGLQVLNEINLCCFVCLIDFLRPINNLSVIKGRGFLS